MAPTPTAPPDGGECGRPLPAALSSFVGRERERADVARLLGASRLVTLTGAGGIGKTRLALQVASDLATTYPRGTCLVELAALADPSLLARAVAAALGLRDDAGRSVLAALLDFLAARRLLLVLDNCEHLLDAAARLTETILRACPDLRILATSREALGLTGEVVSWVPPLAVPPPEAAPLAEPLLGYAAVRLFCERACAARPGFALSAQNAPAAAQLCRRLDGMPLAIELAAARIRALTIEQIVERLDDRFALLTTGSRTAHPRHQTLRRAIEWSYDLLPAGERASFDRLGVFAGGWRLPAAGAVWGTAPAETLDLLARLVERSLVLAEPRGAAVRYRLLETLRQFAREHLAGRGEAEAVGERHARYFLARAEELGARLEDRDLATWLDELEGEHDNLRAALAWLRDRGAAEQGLRLAGALRLFWHLRGHLSEGREWLAQLLALAGPVAPAVRSDALDAAGFLARFQGDYPAARAHIAEGLALRRSLDDRQRVVDSLSNLGSILLFEGDEAAARALYEESLATNRALGNRQGIADALSHLGRIALYRGDFPAARRMQAESLEHWRALGDGQGIGWALFRLAEVDLQEGRPVPARPRLLESLTRRVEVGDAWGIAESLEGLGRLAATLCEQERALVLAGAAAAVSEARDLRYSRRRQAELGAWLQAARRALGPQAARAALARGRAMRLDAAVAYAAAGDPGAAPSAPTPGGGGAGLTPREREVAALVAGGATNREIAGRLVISERTAERHVENILARLGLRSRAQIAAWAVEHGATASA